MVRSVTGVLLNRGDRSRLNVPDFIRTLLDDEDAPAARRTLGAVGAIDRKTATVDVVNTVALTDLYRFTVPANTLGVDKKLRLKINADYLNNSGAGATLAFSAGFGATTLLTATAHTTSPATNANRRLVKIELDLDAKGADNAQVSHFFAYVGNALAEAALDTGSASFSYFARNTAIAEDSTAGKDFFVQAQHGTANANISIRLLSARLELL